jgi:alpha-ribazole phosphatase/probable phosphoglycerate mutase
LGRVRETLTLAREHGDFPAVEDDRLMEWCAGDWSGHLYSEVEEKWPEEFARWQADALTVRPKGGENFQDLLQRGRSFLSEIEARPETTIAIVAHGLINRALAAVLLNLDAQDMLRVRQNNDAIFRVCITEGGAEAHHFIGGEGPYAGLPAGAGAVVA